MSKEQMGAYLEGLQIFCEFFQIRTVSEFLTLTKTKCEK